MTYTPPDGSREEALLSNLRAGIPMLRARFAADFKTLRSLPDAIETTPGLAEAIGEAEAEGARVRAERKRKEASDERTKADSAGGDARGDRAEPASAKGGGDADQDRTRLPSQAAPGVGVGTHPAGAVAPDVSGGADSHRAIREVPTPEAIPAVSPQAPDEEQGSTERRSPAVGGSVGLRDPRADAAGTEAHATTPPAAVNGDASELRTLAASLVARRDADAARVEIVNEATDPLVLITREAARYAPGDFGFVLLVDAKCIAAGMPPMSAWWRWSVGRFYASGKQWGIYLVGRGGGKSTTLERVAASVARYGVRMVPPGQTWTWPFISVGPDDANRRISGIAAVFRADGLAVVGDLDESAGRKVKPGEGVKIARAPRGSLDLEDVRGNSIQLGSIAGTVGNVSGPSTIGLTIDEAAKLIDARGANPLTEIVASAAQTSRGREGWRAIMSSSAFDRAGIHFQLIDAPPNDVNFIATIGADFIDAALDGFERVATWEQRRGDSAAARMIREHAATLRADSPLVPTWTAFPGFGNPAKDAYGRLTGAAWDGAALASRMQAEVLPEAALDGVPPVRFWLRECGSLPMDRGGGVNPMRQLEGLADRNAQLVAAMRGEPIGRATSSEGPMKVAGAPPGDARYPGPPPTRGGFGGGWGDGTVF